MFIQFSDDEINEYAHGPGVYFKNEKNGEPFEVDNNLGEELLRSLHNFGGVQVPVFIRVEPPAKEVYTEAKLKKMGKPALLIIAEKMNAGATADNNKGEIIPKILEAQEAAPAEPAADTDDESDEADEN